jgi:hypothetical protein
LSGLVEANADEQRKRSALDVRTVLREAAESPGPAALDDEPVEFHAHTADDADVGVLEVVGVDSRGQALADLDVDRRSGNRSRAWP